MSRKEVCVSSVQTMKLAVASTAQKARRKSRFIWEEIRDLRLVRFDLGT